jgi:endoglucanase
MGGIVDAGANFAYEVHQYFDADSSGRSTGIANDDPTIGAQRLADFTTWLRANNAKGFLGEFGASASSLGLQTLDLTLDYVESNSDAWIGWTYWNAGPWSGSDPFSVEPENDMDADQMAVLTAHAVAVPEPTALWLAPPALALLGFARTLRQRKG